MNRGIRSRTRRLKGVLGHFECWTSDIVFCNRTLLWSSGRFIKYSFQSLCIQSTEYVSTKVCISKNCSFLCVYHCLCVFHKYRYFHYMFVKFFLVKMQFWDIVWYMYCREKVTHHLHDLFNLHKHSSYYTTNTLMFSDYN